MATMELVREAGIEISSLAYGHRPPQQPNPLPPVSFRGEWGVLQRESRRGATFGRAKSTSNELPWATTARLLSSHIRPTFRHAHRPKTNPPQVSNRPIFKTLVSTFPSYCHVIFSKPECPARRLREKTAQQKEGQSADQGHNKNATVEDVKDVVLSKTPTKLNDTIYIVHFPTERMLSTSSPLISDVHTDPHSKAHKTREDLVLIDLYNLQYEIQYETSTYHSPPATSTPSPSVAAPAPNPTPLRLFPSPHKLSPDASAFYPPTHLPPAINPSLPSAPPIISPANSQQPTPQTYSPTIPSFYHHDISSPYPSSPTLYEAPDYGTPIPTPLSPCPKFHAPQSPLEAYYNWTNWSPSDSPSHHPAPPAPTPTPTL